ncbi:MAG: hypothetical protein WAJ85_07585 [Candidatus Baltobacteraceae bacterium]|jgi:hypothetical protein
MLYDVTSRIQSGNVLEDELIEQLSIALKIDSPLAVNQLIFEDAEKLAARATKAFGRIVRYLGENYVGEHVFNIS